MQCWPIIQTAERWFLTPPPLAAGDWAPDTTLSPLVAQPRSSIGDNLLDKGGPATPRAPPQRPPGGPGATNVVTLGGGPLGPWLLKAAGVVPLDGAGGRAFDAVALYGPVAGRSLGRTLILRGALVLAITAVALLAADYYAYM